MVEETVTVSCWTRACLDRTWDVWTTAPGLQLWWWPHLPDTTYDVDARAGGCYVVTSATARVGARGRFLQVDRPHLLVMTWQWDDDGTLSPASTAAPAEDDLVEATFAARNEGTLVTVRHTIRSRKGLAGYSRGWDRALDRLAQLH